MAHPSAFDVTQPPGSQSIASGDDRIREFKLQLVDRLKLEHHASDGSETNDALNWKHKKSAGRINYDSAAAIPSATSGINGSLFLETDTDLIKYCKNNSTWTSLGAAFHNTANYTYDTGYAKCSSSVTVTGSGVAFVTGGVSTNDIFIGPDSRKYKITGRSASTLTLYKKYKGATTSF